MKRIDTCRSTDILVGVLFGGIVAVLLAYRIFSYLCEVTSFQWWMVPLGAVCGVLAIGGFLLARRAWKRLQYLRDHPEE